MKTHILYIGILALAAGSFSATGQNVWIGNTTRTITETPAANTGLRMVIVAESTAGQNIYYRSSSATISWQRFSSLGGGYAEDMTPRRDSDGAWFVEASADDMGYIITDGQTQTCFWVVNYANHVYDVKDFSISSSDCDRVYFQIVNPATPIAFYTVNGRRVELDRGIMLDYVTLAYNDDDKIYNPAPVSVDFPSLGTTASATVPLCDTQFTLHPDKYATAWGLGHDIATPTFMTTAVEAHTSAVQTERKADNEQPVEAELGGSAPCEITFSAAVTDAAIYHRWEMSAMEDFADVLYTYDSLEFTYTFTEAGTTFVRMTANNAEGTCEFIGDTYIINVGDSYLECPNAFSPGTSEGTNDEWKVSYRSIISFDCHIFNRWGQQLAHLTDPSQGWDGRHGGKTVGPGVYFYVIKARGSDGKDYNLSGDINVIGSRANPTPSTPDM